MFALWYGALFYKTYKDVIWEKISSTKTKPAIKETAIVCPLPSKKPEPSRIPIPEPPRSPSPQLAPKAPASPKTPRSSSPFQPPLSSTPVKGKHQESMKLDITKSPRSPSPHPIQSESFEDIEYEEDDDDDDDADSSEVEEEDENSVISSLPRGNSDFIKQEIISENFDHNQTR